MVTLVNRAKVGTATTGTGPLSLGAAIDGYQSFAGAGVSDGDMVRYVIEDGTAWEIGIGVYSGTSLTRSPDESSNQGAPVSLSGSAVVFLTAASADIAHGGLIAIAQTKAQTAVDVFVYDTSRDSDGGAWRNRCQHTSWYNEPLNTATRGARRAFPAVAVIVLEPGKLTIYDADDPSLPIWAIPTGVSRPYVTSLADAWWIGSASASCLAARDGKILAGQGKQSNPTYGGGLFIFDFAADKVEQRWRAYGGETGFMADTISAFRGDVRRRNALPAITDASINDVAITVLPDAPVDKATRLPVPTIAVATDGGIGLIRDNGTIWNSADTGSFYHCGISSGHLYSARGSTPILLYSTPLAAFESNNFSLSQVYYRRHSDGSKYPERSILGAADNTIKSAGNVAGSSLGLTFLGSNQTSLADSMTCFATASHTTGWMLGDIKGAWLADTDPAVLVASGELVRNGGFDTDTEWTKTEFTISGGVAVPNLTATTCVLTQMEMGLVIGHTYILEFDVSGRTTGNIYPRAGSYGNLAALNTTANGHHIYTFVAELDIVQMVTNVGFDGVIDNITIRRADPDRSVNRKGLIVNGTITRAPVAEGAELVGYSGMRGSLGNWLEQPDNSALDFGTGDFCFMGWYYHPSYPNNAEPVSFYRGDDFYGSGINIWARIASSKPDIYLGRSVNIQSVTSPKPLSNAAWQHIVWLRRSGSVEIYIDGALTISALADRNLDNPNAKLYVGVGASGATTAWGDASLRYALLRISATAPTPNQIARIYTDERKLFQPGAQCTLYGTSDAVTALTHDPDTDLLHVGTSAGRSTFDGFVRVANTQTPVTTAISAVNGLIVEG